jgi:uncharacterized protein (DUF433 family)
MDTAGMKASFVWVDPGRMGGKPCFRGTRVPVSSLFDYLEGGHPLEEFLEDFPTVKRTQAVEAIQAAARQLLHADKGRRRGLLKAA